MSEIKIDYELWAEYRHAYDAKMVDTKVEALNKELSKAKNHVLVIEAKLDEAEDPYNSRIDSAAEKIVAVVLEVNRSIRSHGVNAKRLDGRNSVSWKKVALEAEADDTVIEKHTRKGQPRVIIEVIGRE